MAEQDFTLSSPDFMHGSPIPSRFTCDGENVSPRLEWMHAPEGTRSLALMVDDPDAPGGTFTHWLLFDLPRESRALERGDAESGTAGRNDFQQDRYGGPCPPPKHGEHRYYFKLLALDVASLGLERGAPRAALEAALEGHVLDEAVLMGRYARG
jgi:Raf kinase inhibitor-like YbhB/YbcL family protein